MNNECDFGMANNVCFVLKTMHSPCSSLEAVSVYSDNKDGYKTNPVNDLHRSSPYTSSDTHKQRVNIVSQFMIFEHRHHKEAHLSWSVEHNGRGEAGIFVCLFVS